MTVPLLQFEHVQASHADGTPALRGVSFELHGERLRVALLGGNGAGKSSLFLVLGGFLPYEGIIRYRGESLNSNNIASFRARTGFVFENASDQFFLETIGEDVAFGPRNAGVAESDVTRRVGESLSAVGLEGYESRDPEKLSMGERRLAAIATVLSMRPEWLVLDEPTSNLDLRARRRVLQAIGRFPGHAMILTHDLAAARELTTHALVLSEGCLAYSGPTARLLDHAQARAALGIDGQEEAVRHAI